MEMQVDNMVAASTPQHMKRHLAVTCLAALYTLFAILLTGLALVGWGAFVTNPMELCCPLFLGWLCGSTALAIGLALAAFGLFGCRLWARRLAVISLIGTIAFFGAALCYL